MNKIKILVIIFLSFPFLTTAQIKGLKNFKWPDKPVQTPVNEKFINEDAYLIKMRKSISITMDSKGIYAYTSLKMKIKILTQAGVDNYARIVLPRGASKKISLIDARTIKKDGTAVDLEVEEIKEEKRVDDDKIFDPDRYLLFAVPGVEVGDEIEVIAGYGGYGIGLGQDIYLHNYLATEKSEAIINVVKAITLDIRFYNNLKYPVTNENATEVTYTWNATDLPSLERQSHSVPTLDLPYISYVVKRIKWSEGSPSQEVVGDTWISILDFWAKYYLLSKVQKDSKLDEFFEARWKEKSAADIVSKVKAVHEYLNENMEVVELPDNEGAMAPMTYINNRKIDNQNLFQIYHYLLNKVSPDYYFVMARDFYDGPIDFAFVAFHQINNILFSFKDEAGKMHFVTPLDEDDKFELDEVDGKIQGTKYISLRLTNKSYEISNPKLPFNAPNDNIRSRLSKVELDLETGKAGLKVDELLQGVFSTNYRHYYIDKDDKKILKDGLTDVFKDRNESALVDSASITSFDNTFPYAFKLNYYLSVENTVSNVDEKLYAVSLENWFYHNTEDIYPKTRSMDYYFPQLGKDVFKYYLVFPSNVEMMNGDKINKSFTQPFGNYSLVFSQLNPTTILVESSFTVKQVHIPVAEFGKLAELYQNIEDADNEPLLIKKL